MYFHNDYSSKLYYTLKYGAIKKLDGTNDIEWKGNITTIFNLMNPFEIVRRQEPKPPASNV